ncbi:MAG: hypothetical protein B6D34_07140 [Candidatus Brocadia sp. UTAMX1]|nr:MAG: hypothetical protein B6D34_07140 [Candidatus Brocadia sp. UTAMX1]
MKLFFLSEGMIIQKRKKNASLFRFFWGKNWGVIAPGYPGIGILVNSCVMNKKDKKVTIVVIPEKVYRV